MYIEIYYQYTLIHSDNLLPFCEKYLEHNDLISLFNTITITIKMFC